jgi:hypothetical protein
MKKLSGFFILFLAFALALPGSARSGYKRGKTVTFSGQVIDARGLPMPALDLQLEVSREAFSLRQFKKVEGETLRLPAKTDSNGRFQISWVADRHYNNFRLSAGLEVSRGGQSTFEVVSQHDLSQDYQNGAVENLSIRVESSGFIAWLRGYIDGKASADEVKMWNDHGRPGRLDDYLDGRTAWWFFEIGKVYRLSYGSIDQVQPFSPIVPPTPQP